MIKKRIIFALLYQDGYFHLSRNFKLQKVGDVNWLINNFRFGSTSNYIDELICLLVKKEPTIEDKKAFIKDVNKLREKIFIPITLGGGIRNLKDASDYFNNGADKISLNTSIFQKNLTREISNIYGEQSISIMIDYLKNENLEEQIFSNCGTKLENNLFKFFNRINEFNYGEIILNSIEQDGTGNGLDLNVIKKMPKNLKKKPFLLMGGAGKPEHIVEGLKNNFVSGVITANLFNFLGEGLEESRKMSILNKINLADFSAKIIL